MTDAFNSDKSHNFESSRRPMRMRAEEPLNKGYLVREEEPENQAHQAGCQGKPAAEMLKAVSSQAERGSNADGDEHHARNCPQAKQEKVSDCPTGVPNARQNQQGHRGRSSQTMHDADNKWPQQLIGSDPS